MSFSSALNIPHRAMPYHLALAKYDLLHLTRKSFELCPHPAAPPIALELAATCFAIEASDLRGPGELRYPPKRGSTMMLSIPNKPGVADSRMSLSSEA